MEGQLEKNRPAGRLFSDLFSRRNIFISIGVGCLLASALTSWYQIPRIPSGGPSSYSADYFSPPLQFPFRLLIGLAGIFIIVFRARGKRVHLPVIGVVCLVSTLLFTYLLTTWDPQTAMQAEFLAKQDKDLDDEIHNNYENKEIPWDRTIRLGLINKEIKVFKIIATDKEFLQLANFDRWINGLGYRDEILQFMKLGWFLAWIGSLSLIIGNFLQYETQPATAANRRLFLGLGTIGCLALLSITPLIITNYHLYRARNYEAQGLYLDSIESYRNALKWSPALDCNSQYHFAVGAIYYQNEMGEEADYYNYLGDLYFKGRSFEIAELYYNEALRRRPDHPIARTNLIISLMNKGIDGYNRGHYSIARTSWEKALQIDPINLQALYNLAACYIRLENYDLASELLKRVIKLQSYFQTPAIVVTSQAYLRLSWCHFQRNRYPSALTLSRRAVDLSQWY